MSVTCKGLFVKNPGDTAGFKPVDGNAFVVKTDHILICVLAPSEEVGLDIMRREAQSLGSLVGNIMIEEVKEGP